MPKDLFLILARRRTAATDCLAEGISQFAQAAVIIDELEEEHALASHDVWIKDDLCGGYEGLMGCDHFKPLTGWSKAFRHLESYRGSCTELPSAVWFIEDDVAADPSSLEMLQGAMARTNPDFAARTIHQRSEASVWPWWHKGEGYFSESQQWMSFNPLCRMSWPMVHAVLDWRTNQGHFIFHELLFPTLAQLRGFTLLDWQDDPEVAHLFGEFRFRPVITEPAMPGISHPVKCSVAHLAVTHFRT